MELDRLRCIHPKRKKVSLRILCLTCWYVSGNTPLYSSYSLERCANPVKFTQISQSSSMAIASVGKRVRSVECWPGGVTASWQSFLGS